MLLDLWGVWEALDLDNKAWEESTQILVSRPKVKIPLGQAQENFNRALEKHLEVTVGMYNSMQNLMLSSPYAVQMMS
jgi:hypothetical protein